MTDTDETLGTKEPTIAVCATQCLVSFQECLLQASSVHPRELSVVEDQAARLSTWAAGIEVFAHGRASMDHRLRYAPELQNVVTGLLESLNYRIRACSSVLGVLGKSAASGAQNSVNKRLEQCFIDIATEISRLNKTSSTICRASKEDQVLELSDFQITDNDGNNVEPLLLCHFENHISSRYPSISKIIQQRLACAMLLRQKRILYRRHQKVNTAIQPQKAIPKALITLSATQPGVPSAHRNPRRENNPLSVVAATAFTSPQIQTVTTSPPDNLKIGSSSPFVNLASKTVALSNHEALIFPPAPGLAAKRKYEQLKNERVANFQNAFWLGETISDAESKLNDLLKSDLQAIGDITCPYCLYALPAEEMFDEQKWQNHVKNDLDPYVCLFEDCKEAELLYNDSDDWLSHLHQHSKLWRCSSHRELGPFSTREDYIRHIREAHNTNLNDNQLRILANKNARKAMKPFLSCPICGKDVTEADGQLEDHIAEHLISLALKSLPSYQDEIPDDNQKEKDSIRTSQPQSKHTVDYTMEDIYTPEYGTEHFKRKRPNHYLASFERPSPQSPGRSLSSESFLSSFSSTEPSTIPSISSKPSARRLPFGQVPLLSSSRPHAVTDSSSMGTMNGTSVPKKGRGRRTHPLEEGKRKAATRRRNERSVCIGCKLAKVMCEDGEDGKDCSQCASGLKDPPRPFVCAPASFIEFVQQKSTALFALHIIYPDAFTSNRQPIELPSDIDIRHTISYINALQKDYDAIRIYGRKGLIYELDLHACSAYIASNFAPTRHPFWQFIDDIKLQRQDHWKLCVRDGHIQPLSDEYLCDTLLALDDTGPWVTYALRPKPGDSDGKTNDKLLKSLFPDHAASKEATINITQLSRIIGRQLELQFYDQLKRALGKPNIGRKVVLDIGRTLISLRRRLAQWTHYWAGVSFLTVSEHESPVNNEGKSNNLSSDSIIRLKKLCKILYVYFCFMRRRLPVDEQKGLQTIMVLYPDRDEEAKENFPQHESIDGFEEWLSFKDQPVAETTIDNNQM
ncbi:hypothetical protein MKX08_007602 [Trichoderma sp. CBMAI-0020]|nr:hypothetical protein MKX08_007602 [Trichoderma sp. CBMAI-0020]